MYLINKRVICYKKDIITFHEVVILCYLVHNFMFNISVLLAPNAAGWILQQT